MALTSKSIDEETTGLADVFDSLIAPKRIMRSHNNKIYLILRAYAAGMVSLTDAALALRNRFDPASCEDIDLYNTAKLVGTDFKEGTGSIVNITIRNKDIREQKKLLAGVYQYQSASGMIFSFEAANDYAFDPKESKVISAISRQKGAYEVARNDSIKLFRPDGQSIDGAFVFSCADNAGQLGYPDESAFEFRSRILNDANRQDHIKELELKIRNLPNIFECNLVINEGVEPSVYDGVTLEPKELLITITGVPTDDIAKIVAESVLYATHPVDPANVVYYHSPYYTNGRYPVYYRFHGTTDFALSVTFQYDRDKLKLSQVTEAINALFQRYTRPVTHIDTFSEGDAYGILSNLNLPNVKALDVNIFDAAGNGVPYISIPKTRLARLTGIAFEGVESGGTP